MLGQQRMRGLEIRERMYLIVGVPCPERVGD